MAPPKVGKQHFCKHYHSAKNDADGRSRREVGLAFWRTWVDLRGIGEACANRLHHSPSADVKAPQHCRQSRTQRHRQPIQQPKQMCFARKRTKCVPLVNDAFKRHAYLRKIPGSDNSSTPFSVAPRNRVRTSCVFMRSPSAPPRIAGGFLGAAARARLKP